MNKTKALLVVSAVTFPPAGYAYLDRVKRGIVRLLVAYTVFFGGRAALGVMETLPVTNMIAAAYFAAWAGYGLLVVFTIKWIVEDMLAILESKSQSTNSKSPVAA